jgi:hypothetical protein
VLSASASPARPPGPGALGRGGRLAALAGLTFAALILRAWVLVASGRLGADEAIPGLMPRHIVGAHELPVFYWGQAYFGAAESYAIAALFVAFGFHPWLVFVPALAASVALVPLVWALGEHVWTAYPITYLSGEAVVVAPALPFAWAPESTATPPIRGESTG